MQSRAQRLRVLFAKGILRSKGKGKDRHVVYNKKANATDARKSGRTRKLAGLSSKSRNSTPNALKRTVIGGNGNTGQFKASFRKSSSNLGAGGQKRPLTAAQARAASELKQRQREDRVTSALSQRKAKGFTPEQKARGAAVLNRKADAAEARGDARQASIFRKKAEYRFDAKAATPPAPKATPRPTPPRTKTSAATTAPAKPQKRAKALKLALNAPYGMGKGRTVNLKVTQKRVQALKKKQPTGKLTGFRKVAGITARPTTKATPTLPRAKLLGVNRITARKAGAAIRRRRESLYSSKLF